MMKVFSVSSSKPAWFLIGLLTVIVCLWGVGRSAAGQGDKKSEQKPNEPAPSGGAIAPSTVVARIGDYAITAEELEQRMMRELYPRDYDITVEDAKPVEAEKVLLKMIAEKAMMLEGRERGYLEKESISTSIKQFKDGKLVGLVARKYIEANEAKIAATEDEIKQKMLVDPNITRERAAQTIRRVKGNRLLNQYYAEIKRKSDVKKLSQNLPKVIQIHQRLMTKPKKPRKVDFIRTWQVRDELTQSEKDMVLVQFNGGKVTLYDWFTALTNIVPPRRPRNLNTITGVEQLLDRVIFSPLMVAEAKSLGLDRDKDFLKEVRDYEDRRLLSEVRVAKQKETKEPTSEEILAYFNNHKEAFVTGRHLKMDVIWCENLEMAKKAKAELDAGKDFESVKQQYSLDEKDKTAKPVSSYPGSEGLFWKDLLVSEPNDVLGPLKGFHDQKIQWRIVKILEKDPGKPREYSENMNGQIKSEITSERNEALMEQYSKELLEKYSYQLYADKIEGIDPLNIP
jgi:hypothetical protein